jgi:phosphinothricin acetyltransferase
MASTIVITDTTAADIPAITAMFATEVRHGTASWAYEPPTHDEMLEKFQRLTADNYPFLTARLNNQNQDQYQDPGQNNNTIVGFSFASAYRPREGYRFLCEDSIYVHEDFRRHGIASQLLTRLIKDCTERGYRQMVAVIGDSANTGSIALHERMGFVHVGVLKDIGYKFDRWLDSVLMQRTL